MLQEDDADVQEEDDADDDYDDSDSEDSSDDDDEMKGTVPAKAAEARPSNKKASKKRARGDDAELDAEDVCRNGLSTKQKFGDESKDAAANGTGESTTGVFINSWASAVMPGRTKCGSSSTTMARLCTLRCRACLSVCLGLFINCVAGECQVLLP